MTTRRFAWAEVLIVLGLSLGRAGVYAVVALLDRLTRETALGEQTTALNPQLAARAWLDAIYQLLGIGFSLLPVLLALYLLGLVPGGGSGPVRGGARAIGLTGAMGQGRAWLDALGLAALIGIPGLGLYAMSRAAGVTVQLETTPESVAWWSLVILILAALRNGLLEEVIAVGYLMERCDQAGVRPAVSVGTSCLLRGTYHLYQGPAMAAGNVVMGVLYAAYYRRTRSTLPLVIAHTLIDVVAFLGPVLISTQFLTRLGLV